MQRTIVLAPRTPSIVALCLLSSGAVPAADPAPVPQPVRMWHVGNSWSCPFPFDQVGLPRTFTHGLGGPTSRR